MVSTPDRGIYSLVNPRYAFNRVTPVSLFFLIGLLLLIIGIVIGLWTLIKVGLFILGLFILGLIVFVVMWLKGTS